jgi:ubiquinone biosynthesis protein COQ9
MSEAMRERQELRDRVGEAALGHAAFDGWVRRTLYRAAEDAGVDRGTAVRLFPQGAESLLDWLADWADRQMEQAIDPEELARLPVRRRIARLVRARLEALTPHREAVRRAAIARSIDALAGGRELWRTVDRVWQAVGLPEGADRGVGFYSRRATLAGVLTATFLYWLEDSSADCADSWAFLDRRIEDVMRLGRVTSRVSDVVGRMPGMRSSARSDAARP